MPHLPHVRLLKLMATPRVRVAVFCTRWNRWNTHRRWQRREHPHNQCLLRCSPTAEDSIERYCQCATVRMAMQRYLKLDPYYYGNRHTFMLVNTHIDTMETLTTIALLIYGTYITTNTLRHRQRQHELARRPHTYTTCSFRTSATAPRITTAL